MLCGPFVHNIDPIIMEIGGVYLWWYGLSYTLGFLGVFFWLRRSRERLGMGMSEVYTLSVYLSLGVLLGGRIIEVFFYEWAYYGTHPWHIPAVWLGGMSTHGILLGAVAAIVAYCLIHDKPFLAVADELAIAGAYIMGVGRIGNFIDGQIVGSLTDVCWGVQFPDVEGFRHPVVLYDGLKNLLLIPWLLFIRSRRPPAGVVLAHFILWYGFLRIFVDFFREYRTDFLGFPPGQEFNVFMACAGLTMLVWFHRRGWRMKQLPAVAIKQAGGFWHKRMAFAVLLLVPLVIPSDWTQDVPARYGKRHPGLEHSLIYPVIPAFTDDGNARADSSAAAN